MMMRCNDDDAIGRSVAMASHSKEEILQCTVSGTFPSLQYSLDGIFVFLAVKHAGERRVSTVIASSNLYTVQCVLQ
jgi:hypothetical protein